MSSAPQPPSPEALVAALLPQLNAARGLGGFGAALAEALCTLGVPLLRMSTSLLTIHPEVMDQNCTWLRGGEVRVTSHSHELAATPDYLDSPVAAIHAGSPEIRLRLDVPEAALPYRTLGGLQRQGATGYVALPLLFTDGRRSCISFATDAPGGFSPRDLELLRAFAPAVALRLELESTRHASRALLEVYLGRNAARRVLEGHIRRGHGERLQAAVWFCDLRDFTALVDRQPVEQVIPLLDRYFERVSDAVTWRGGDVLKFIGDAMLAMFPVEADPGPVCHAVLEAAELALEELRAITTPSGAPLAVGIGLHLGEVLYGNVGARDRLDFTVIGRAVNEVTRVERLCRELSVPLLMSGSFARGVGDEPRLASVGTQALRGVSQPHELFTLAHLLP